MRVTGLSLAGAIGATYPNAANTGASLPASLYAISNGVATTAGSAVAAGFAGNTGWTWSGTTWSYSGTAPVLSALNIPVELDINASSTTVQNSALVRIVVAAGSAVSNTVVTNCSVIRAPTGDGEGIKLGGGGSAIPTDTTIQYCTIAGLDAAANRLGYGIQDNYGNLGGVTIPGGLLVLGCNIYYCRSGIQIASGIVQGCYIHDEGFTGVDHSDCFLTQGGANAAGPLLITGNTMLNDLTQTAAILLASEIEPATYMTVTGNLLAGGSYPLYGGNSTDQEIRQDKNDGTAASGTITVTDASASVSSADLGATITSPTAGIFASNTHIIGVSGSVYTLSQATTGAGSSLEFDIQQPYGQRTDPLSTIASGTILTDYSLQTGDAGASVTATGAGTVPTSPLTTITAVIAAAAAGVPGTAHLSQACTNGSITATLHYTNNIVITDNRLSTVYFPRTGHSGTVSEYDQYGVGNIWTNNVIHETGAQIPS